MGLIDITSGRQTAIPLHGAQVVRLMLGGVIEMSLAPPEVECTIGTEFEIQSDSAKWSGAPDAQPAPDWGPLTALLWDRVRSIEVQKDSSLVIEFDSGSAVRIPPNDEHEAWSLAARDGSRAVCGPGGDISSWDAIFPSTDDASWLRRRG
jgi:hypothetical protein